MVSKLPIIFKRTRMYVYCRSYTTVFRCIRGAGLPLIDMSRLLLFVELIHRLLPALSAVEGSVPLMLYGNSCSS